VIPCFNEAAVVGHVVRDVRERLGDAVADVIVIDDASTDGSAEAAAEAGATVISHTRNRGYGAALRTGIVHSKSDLVATMDGDGQHSAEDLERLWHEADVRGRRAATPADMVVGSRNRVLHSRLWRMPGKWILWLVANYLVKQRIPDLNSGMRLMRREVVMRYLHLCPAGFSFSTTITMVMLSRGYDVRFVPIRVQKRTGTSTVKIKTGFDTLILILRIATTFNPLRLFIPASLLMWIIGLAWGLPIVLAREGVSVGALLAFVTGTLFFALGLLSDQISQMRLERFENLVPGPGRQVPAKELGTRNALTPDTRYFTPDPQNAQHSDEPSAPTGAKREPVVVIGGLRDSAPPGAPSGTGAPSGPGGTLGAGGASP
jgi:glycosyltransferase involved in cell wall biosynthesis